jgi:hypothetical protein
MLQGVFQRAAVAILLIGALAAPAEICLQHAHKTGHDCCASMSESSATVQSDCCTVRPTLPAVVVAPALSGSPVLSAAQQVVSSRELSSPSELTVSTVIPPQSPPTGASILRI